MLTSSSFSPLVGSSSVTSDYGSDTAYETSELGTPRLGMDDSSEIGLEDLTLDEDLTNPIEKLAKYGMSNIDEGLFMGQTILDQLEGLNKHKSQGRHVNKLLVKDTYNGNGSKDSLRASNGMGLFLEPEPGNMARHAHKLSSESVGSEGSSLRGSEMSNSGIPNLNLNGYLDLRGGAEVSSTMDIDGNTELQVSGDSRVILPMDQRNKMNRVLLTMKQRLVTAKTDMEDLIARLNQEIAVKDYLTTKVKDLELELETDKQRNKENLQQAILVEKERLTQMKWDMEELRRKSLEMELQLQSKQDDKPHTEQTEEISLQERDKILLELDTTKQQLQNMSRRNEELEAKSKADIKILVKEVKSLRSSQSKLKQELGRSLTDKSEAENFLREERQMNENLKVGRQKLLHECSSLYNRLMECNTNLLSIDEEGKLVEDSSNLEGALDLLTTSDDRIALLLAEAQLLANGDETATDNVIIQRVGDDELRKMLASIFIENAKLRKQVNFFIRRALKLDTVSPYEN